MCQAMIPQQLLLLLIVCSSKFAVSWPNDTYSKNFNQMRRQSSWNGNSLSTKDIESGINHYALLESVKNSGTILSGAMGTFDVYGLRNFYTQTTSSKLCVINQQGDDYGSQNAAIAGWIVSPSHYGDSKTHFFTEWTADGYRSIGCYNLECDGFVPVKNAPITPGDTLDPKDGKLKITIQIFKKKNDGDWWLYFGYDNENLRAVGFWPKHIFSNMADHASYIQWGGYTMSNRGSASPAMGNGHWPGIHSATVRDIGFVDDSGMGHRIYPWEGRLVVSISHRKCYGAVHSSFDEMFYYGGPGGCTM